MEIYLNIHGVTAKLTSDSFEFIDLVKSNFQCFLIKEMKDEAPNLTIKFDRKAGLYAREMKSLLPRLSSGLYQNQNAIFWENEFGFAVQVQLNNLKSWEINGYHFDLDSENSEEDRFKNYTRSMRWMIHFPIFSLLKKYHNMRLIHASTLSKDSEALVFAGLNKVGKSSLSRYIFENYNFQYMSDNFLLSDSDQVYGFPEKNRLSPESMSNLDIDFSGEREIYGKYQIPLEEKDINLIAKPKTVFIVNNYDSLIIEEISSETALNTIEAMHNYLQEFPDYTFYSMLDSFDTWKQRNDPLFSNDISFFKLYLPLNWSFQEAATKVLRCI